MPTALATFALLALPALAAEPAPKLDVPKMSREEALAYVAEADLALTGSNLVGPIMNGDAETVEALLSAGVDVNDLSALPKPAMRIAMQPCAAKQLTTEQILITMEVLLAHGAKINEPPGAVLTPLVTAAQWCPAPVLRRLVEAGAEIDYKTNLGHSALSMAFLMRNYDAAEALIDAGAKLSSEAAAKLLEGKEDDARRVELLKKARSK